MRTMTVQMLYTRQLRNGAGATLVAHKGQTVELPENVAKRLIDGGEAKVAERVAADEFGG